jgi:DNA-binding transcriptional MerR regulator
MKVETAELLSIGRFARLTGLTAKALRHYDELGLLRPAHVDSWTSYRWYSREQVGEAVAIRRLRALRVPLEVVAELVHADDGALRDALAVHRARLEGDVVETRHVLAELDRLIEGREQLVIELAIDPPLVEEPVRRYAVVGARVRIDDMSTHVPQALLRTRGWLDARGVPCIDPAASIFLAAEEDEWLDVDVGWPILDAEIEEADGIVVRELPPTRAAEYVHRGPFEQLPDVFRAMERSLREQGLEPGPLPREYYVGHRNNRADPAEYETRIVWPVASP